MSQTSTNLCAPLNVALGAASYAATGALTGVVGAAILKDAHHAGYDTLVATRHGAIGGAILGVPATALVNAFVPINAATGRREWWVDGAIGAGISAASGALGAAVLNAAAHPTRSMDSAQSAAACAVGSGVFLAAGAALSAAVLVAIHTCSWATPKRATPAATPVGSAAA